MKGGRDRGGGVRDKLLIIPQPPHVRRTDRFSSSSHALAPQNSIFQYSM